MPVLPDLLQENLRLIICGSAVGQRSALIGHYYAGIGNKLWRTLQETGLTPSMLQPSEAPLLLRHGIGLTDLVKSQSGGDHSIRFDRSATAQLRAKILKYTPGYLCFNGKRAAQEFYAKKDVNYGLQPDPIGPTTLFVAPSTSAAANGSWDLSVWQELARQVRSHNAAT